MLMRLALAFWGELQQHKTQGKQAGFIILHTGRAESRPSVFGRDEMKRDLGWKLLERDPNPTHQVPLTGGAQETVTLP